MEAIDILTKEHDLIREFLENLALTVNQLEVGENPPREFFEKGRVFAGAFADKYHHYKEEYVMFAHLAEKREGEIDEQIDSLRYQHERARNYWVEILSSLDGYERGGQIPTTKLLENTASYVSLLRRHIHREDHVFYPMAEELLSDQEHRMLLDEFAKVNEKYGGEMFERSRQLVREMGQMLEEE